MLIMVCGVGCVNENTDDTISEVRFEFLYDAENDDCYIFSSLTGPNMGYGFMAYTPCNERKISSARRISVSKLATATGCQ